MSGSFALSRPSGGRRRRCADYRCEREDDLTWEDTAGGTRMGG
jgi:hypothetical protein